MASSHKEGNRKVKYPLQSMSWKWHSIQIYAPISMYLDYNQRYQPTTASWREIDWTCKETKIGTRERERSLLLYKGRERYQ